MERLRRLLAWSHGARDIAAPAPRGGRWPRCAAALAVVPLLALAQAAPQELEFWRSAQRIDTVEAYEAYLAAYPNGAFAALARAAARKSAPVPGPAPSTARAVDFGVSTPPSRRVVGEAATGAVAFTVGDSFTGPGVVTVGWLGSKRQLVLPPGHWLVLAAYDYRTTETLPAPMTALAFGLLQGTRVRSVLAATFNRQQVSAGNLVSPSSPMSLMLPRWTGFERCEDAQQPTLHREARTTRALRLCSRALPVGAEAASAWPAEMPELPQRVQAGAAAAGVALPVFHLRSEVHAVDHRGGYLGMTRLDCLAEGEGAGGCAAADTVPRALVDARVDWLKPYALLVQQGYGREFDLFDLETDAAKVNPSAPPAPMTLRP